MILIESNVFASEKKLEDLRVELDGLRRSGHEVFSVPPREWLAERMMTIQTVLERRTQRSALLLRKLLGTIRMVLAAQPRAEKLKAENDQLKALLIARLLSCKSLTAGWSLRWDSNSNSVS